MTQGLSVAKFAEQSKCDRKQVYRALKYGTLSRNADGLLDARQLKTDWRKSDKRTLAVERDTVSHPSVGTGLQTGETPEEAAERLASGHRQPYASSMAKKEHYAALLRQFEYDQKSGAVVLVADVAHLVSEEYANVRRRLLSIPAEQAPRVHRAQTILDVQLVLEEIITEALEGLTSDRNFTSH